MPATPVSNAKTTEKLDLPLITLGGQLNTLDALINSMIRAGYLDMTPPSNEDAEHVNNLLALCRKEVRQAIELCQLCEERYNAQRCAELVAR